MFGPQRLSSVTFVFATVLLTFLYICVPNVEARTSDILKAQLPHGGILVGRHLTSHYGRHMRAFMGIPYALPPLGDLRFKSPVPYGSWQGERLATADAAKCTQRDPFRRDMEMEGSEDCLYLNVYTPEETTVEKLPVMIWFHGGGWQCGSGISGYYGPDFLMDNDIVLVSANFRLGPLGFLSTETVDCPGNFGLKDQLEVLKWIQQNIASFGGDPNSVTVFGESAGGASATYLMMSEKSKGLFHRAIAQSGTYFNPWAQPAHKGVAAQRAKKLAKLVHCDGDNWTVILSCLRQRSAADIVATIYDLFEWDFDPMIPFPPVVEPEHKDAFITELPRMHRKPHGLALPLLIGSTADEGVMKTAPLLNLPNLLDEFKSQFPQVLPIILNYDHHTAEIQKTITDKIEAFYFNYVHNYNKNNHQNLTDLISDGWFIAGIDEYIRLRMQNKKIAPDAVGPTYVYLFDHKGASSFSEIFQGGKEEYYGVSHAEELQYLFPIGKELFITATPTERDLQVRDMLVRMWINFAYTSNPTPQGSDMPVWKEATSYPVRYARIGSKNESESILFRMEQDLYPTRADFWKNLQAHVPTNVWKKDEL